jgi:hypothetical protein
MRISDECRLPRAKARKTAAQLGGPSPTVVDDFFGTVHVCWDDRHAVDLVPGEDRWRVVEDD